eukprot:355589-Chlamydomonas_euryale.AAC.1
MRSAQRARRYKARRGLGPARQGRRASSKLAPPLIPPPTPRHTHRGTVRVGPSSKLAPHPHRYAHARAVASPTENRERFQQAAASKPESFSSVQMQTYLKASAFRQQIETHKKKIGGGAVAEGDARRIASEHSREFVFRRDGERARHGGDGAWDRGGAGGQRRAGLSKVNAAALAAPLAEPLKMAPLATRIALAAFKGTHMAADAKDGGAVAGDGGSQVMWPLRAPAAALGSGAASAAVAALTPAAAGVTLDVDLGSLAHRSGGDGGDGGSGGGVVDLALSSSDSDAALFDSGDEGGEAARRRVGRNGPRGADGNCATVRGA